MGQDKKVKQETMELPVNLKQSIAANHKIIIEANRTIETIVTSFLYGKEENPTDWVIDPSNYSLIKKEKNDNSNEE